MQSLKEKLKNKKWKKEEKPSTEWQEMGKEMSKFFKANCYWLMWKYPKQKIYEGYRECQTRKIASLNYLLGILKKS